MIKWLLFFVLIIFGIWIFKFSPNYPFKINVPHQPEYWGVTFSKKFAKELDLDWQKLYLAILDELKVKKIRLPIYWDEIEPSQNNYYFSDYDWLVSEADKRGVELILVIGQRQPRWPECHQPNWVNDLIFSYNEKADFLKKMIKSTVQRYRGYQSVKMWQVENEPFLRFFGECPKPNKQLIAEEVALVKSLDNRPIMVTASGELSFWNKEKKIGDRLGITLYRVVWDRFFGYIRYPWPPFLYHLKMKLIGLPPNKVIVSELQAEPWASSGGLKNLSKNDQEKSFSPKQFEANLQYAVNLRVNSVYLWGVEWWYWQKELGNNFYWNRAIDLFNSKSF